MQTGRYYVVDQIEQAFYDLMKEKDYTNLRSHEGERLY